MSKGSEFSIHCQSCSFSHLCLPVSLNKTELDSLDDMSADPGTDREEPAEHPTVHGQGWDRREEGTDRTSHADSGAVPHDHPPTE